MTNRTKIYNLKTFWQPPRNRLINQPPNFVQIPFIFLFNISKFELKKINYRRTTIKKKTKKNLYIYFFFINKIKEIGTEQIGA